MHTVSAHCLLVKTVRWFNSHQELLPRKTVFTQKAGRLSGGEGSVPECDRVTHLPQWMSLINLQPHTHIHYGKHEKAEMRGKSLDALGNLETAAAATGAGRTQRFTEMKGFGHPVAIGLHYKCELLQNSPSPSPWFTGNTTRVYAGSIFFPPEPLRMESK